MPKGYKIRRSRGSIYRRNRNKVHSPLAFIGGILLIIALVAVGWFVYPPIYDFITGVNRPATSEPSSVASVPEVPTPVASEPEATPEPQSTEVRAVYAPHDVMRDTQRLETLLGQASAAGCNAVMFDAKDATGMILYNTANTDALAYSAVSPTAFDLTAAVQLMKTYKMKPMARLSIFRDHAAARFSSSMAVLYQNQADTLWVDDYPDKGGKPWLNPNSTAAQNYNIALAQECVDSGVPLIVASGVQFPTARGGLDKAGYGNMNGKSQGQILLDFTARLEEVLAKSSGELIIEASATAVLTPEALPQYGTPSSYSGLLVNAMPAVWGTGSPLLNTINPIQDPYGTILSAIRSVQGATKARLIPYVQAYTDNNAAAAGKKYTQAEITAQLDALSELGLKEYVIYSPDALYPFA